MKLLSAISAVLISMAASAHCQNSPCFATAPPAAQIKACSDAITTWDQKDGNVMLAAYHLKRSSAYATSGDLDHAIEDATKSVQLVPGSDDALLNRAWIYMRMERYPDAVKDLSPVVKSKNPRKSGWAYYSLAINYYLLGKNAAAQTHVSAGKINAPDLYNRYVQELNYFVNSRERKGTEATASFETGKQLVASGNFDGAVASFVAALSSYPANAEYTAWMASALYDAGKSAESLKTFNTMEEGDRWNYYMGLSLLKLSRYDDAAAAFTLAEAETPPKNRGKDVSQEAKEYVSRISDYQLAMKRALELTNRNAPYESIMAELQKANSAMPTPEVKRAIERRILEQKTADRDRSAGFTHMVVTMLTFGLMIIAGIFAYKRYKAIKSDKAAHRENGFNFVTAKPARDAVMAYFDFKADDQEDAPELAQRLLKKVAASHDFELIKTFISELEGEKRHEFLATAAAIFAASGRYDECMDALQLINMIPFLSWGEAETAVFINAHLAADNVLLTGSKKGDPTLWPPDIPAATYMKLAAIYSDKKNYAFTEGALECLPVYKWEKPQWDLYISTKETAGRLDTIDISSVSADYKLYVVEKLIKLGKNHKKVREFLINEPRQKWLKEYYLYMFIYLIQDHYDEPNTLHFDSAWDQYKQMSDLFDVRKSAAARYMFAMICERVGRFDRAADVYKQFKEAAIIYKDEIKRLLQITNNEQDKISPKAAEVLLQILPADFFPSRPPTPPPPPDFY